MLLLKCLRKRVKKHLKLLILVEMRNPEECFATKRKVQACKAAEM